MTDEERFARWMSERMDARQMSTRHLAHRSGVNHSTISRLKKGERHPSLGTALRIARILGVDSMLEALNTTKAATTKLEV